jgi:hypothetical protein
MALVLAVGALLGSPTASGAPPADKRPRNIIFVITDQEAYHLTARGDYKLPPRQALMRRGVTFRNHYIASAMCTPSRAHGFVRLFRMPPLPLSSGSGIVQKMALGEKPRSGLPSRSPALWLAETDTRGSGWRVCEAK